VKSCSAKGCFVVLGPGGLDAHIKLKNLSPTFLPDPAAIFFAGKAVQGRYTQCSQPLRAVPPCSCS